MEKLKLLRLLLLWRVIALGLLSMAAVIFIACATNTPQAADTPAPGVFTATVTATGTTAGDPTQQSDAIQVPEFDTAAFAEINPNPDIRGLDRGADIRVEFDYYERDRIPRDAINPVYTPSFVSAAEATLRDIDLVMGLEINGDARAYPVGMMRIREMVNDEVGGTPVLVTW